MNSRKTSESNKSMSKRELVKSCGVSGVETLNYGECQAWKL
nr:MAG TPA: hypothetical protein [Caudoviricetes sp.]